MASALLKALPAGPVTDAKLVELFSQLVEDERAKSTAPDGANIPMPKIERFVANGRKLAAAGSISDTTTDAARERGEVTATCAGSSNGSCYRLELRHEGDDPSFSCNCPYFTGAQNGFCKHIVALVIWHCKRLGEKARERECEEQRERKTKAGEKDEDGWFSRPAPRRSHESGGKSKSGASRGGSVAGADSGTGSGPTTVKPEQGREKADEEAEASMDDIFDDWLGGDTRKEIDRRREQEEREEKERRERQAAEELKKESKKKVKGADSDSMDDLFDDWLGGGGAVGKEEKKEAEGLRAQTTTTTTTTATTGASVSRKEAGSDRRSDLLKDQKRQREPQEGSSQAASVSESPRRRKPAAASPLRTRAQPTAPPSVDVDSWREDLEERLTQSKRARKKAGGKVSFTAKFLKLGYKLKPSGE
mmetsp:Transcript_14547/g.30377  ORF Transcript_14547/g.30377 Transcript_14547/m.30377 type:complete len:420 (-) Transcript_14547:44-1303(-)